MNIAKIIGQRIKDERLRQEMSQEKLAELIESHRNHISKIEQGQKRPNVETLHKISVALKIPLEKLFKGM